MSKKDIIARSVYTFLEGAENAISAAKFRVQIRVVGANGGLAQIDFSGALSDGVADAQIDPGELSPEAPEAEAPETPIEAPPTFPAPADPERPADAPAKQPAGAQAPKRGRPRKSVEPAAPIEPKETHIVQDISEPKAPGGENDTAPDLPIPEDTIPLPDRLAQVAMRDGVPPEFVVKFCIERDRLPKTATSDDLRADDAVIGWALTCWGTIRDVYTMRQDAAAKNHPSAPTS